MTKTKMGITGTMVSIISREVGIIRAMGMIGKEMGMLRTKWGVNGCDKTGMIRKHGHN